MHEKIGLHRLLIARNDLDESRSYLEDFLAFANSFAYCDAYGQLGLDMARRVENAFLSCGLIAYARPFVQSRGGDWKSVPGRYTSKFTKVERQVHNYVLRARKKLIAHSDFDGVDARIIKTDQGDRVLSIRPAPIVMITGEADSLSVEKASSRTTRLAANTLDDFLEILQETASATTDGRTVFIQEERWFEIDSAHCELLIGMIEKVSDAIELELDDAGLES